MGLCRPLQEEEEEEEGGRVSLVFCLILCMACVDCLFLFVLYGVCRSLLQVLLIICACVYVCIYVQVLQICVYVCVHTHTYTHTHTHTHTQVLHSLALIQTSPALSTSAPRVSHPCFCLCLLHDIYTVFLAPL